MNNTIYIKKENNNYYLVYNNLKEICFIGKKGMTNQKKEGDQKTPIGEFKLGIAFGTHPRKEIKLDNQIKYIKINKNLYWVDDQNSKYYNQLIDKRKVKKDWISAEYLQENAKPYEYAIEIKANENNIKGKGSAIFIHCKNKDYTLGCIAIQKNSMIKLLSLINKDTKIKIEE